MQHGKLILYKVYTNNITTGVTTGNGKSNIKKFDDILTLFAIKVMDILSLMNKMWIHAINTLMELRRSNSCEKYAIKPLYARAK